MNYFCENEECLKELNQADDDFFIEDEITWICRGEEYDTLEEIPMERRDDAHRVCLRRISIICHSCGSSSDFEESIDEEEEE